jgi:hypothetical protein
MLILENYQQEGSRDLMRSGYRLRLAEREVIGERMLVPIGHIEEILHSDQSLQEKTLRIAEYLATMRPSASEIPLGYTFSCRSMTCSTLSTVWWSKQSRRIAAT